ncbi:hypothetical protein [Gimesia aquarii]|uniref:Uncharacterized protein n=1 Tax=Gimesia aquarii TaxID=2527964 RepID=A0A517WR07_9PLAN|nr:hypothetical protein [Gimesia aquarii]QDU07683.1 hypothetical protein V202x_10440 [Gimesia aquarii]
MIHTNIAKRISYHQFGFLIFLCALIGCGGSNSGLTKYDYSGTVTFNGKPIPIGYISFEPDSLPGPGSMAKIIEGRYETPAGKGLLGGPYKILISGFEGSSNPEALGDGAPIFVDYHLIMTLPEKSTTQNFEITSADIKQNKDI